MKRIFNKPFRATGKIDDISMVPISIHELHKKEYFDANGDLYLIEYYTDYEQATDTFTNLAINEERTYSRDTNTGLLVTRTTDITWYDIDGAEAATKIGLLKYYSAKKGFVSNKRARQNIIDQASMYLFSQLLANDAVNADANVDDFESLTNSAQSKYINSNIEPLLEIITNSTDNTKPEYRTYITAAMQSVLLSILTINYK